MFFWNKINRLEKQVINLQEQNQILVKTITDLSSKKIITLWSVEKFTKIDTENLKKNKDWVKLMMKYLLNQIMLKTDMIRNKEDRDEKVWYINCLHELYNFLEKLTQTESKKEEYSWQNLK